MKPGCTFVSVSVTKSLFITPMKRSALRSRIFLLSDQNLSHSIVTTRFEKP